MKEEKGRDWVKVINKEFGHPATILWRAIEVARFEEAIRKFSQGGSVLDLGCAEGKIGGILFKNKRIFGLDNCWELLRQNKKADTYRSLILADACNMPFKKEAFGCVFSNSVIEHIPDLETLLGEVKNILKDRGLFIFTVPSDKFAEYLFFSTIFANLRLNTLAEKYKNSRNRWLNHFHCYGHNAWREKLEQKNLKILNYSYYISKKTAMFWDFLAAVAFIMNKLGGSKLVGRLNAYFLPHIMNTVRLDSAENNSGAGLLIVARKQ